MKKFTFLALGALLSLASCTSISPITATENPIGDKVGKSKTSCLFPLGPLYNAGEGFNVVSSGICFNGKYGVLEAAKKGGINKIATVDLKQSNFLFFSTYELIVTGE